MAHENNVNAGNLFRNGHGPVLISHLPGIDFSGAQVFLQSHVHAIITHETPAVTRYYLERFSRPDLNSQVISSSDFDPEKLAAPAYTIVQRGRIYFENRKKIDFIRDNFKKVYEVKIKEATAAEIFVNEPM
jgi:hypothetical protein